MTAQQLSSHGIGASEISAVVGMNPHASPWDVYLRKIGDAPDVESNGPMEWGNRLEPAIRQKYADDTKQYVYVPKHSLFHPTHAWARATPDGAIAKQHSLGLPHCDSEPGCWERIVQCKNVGTWVEKAWVNAPPVYVQLQEQWEMMVTGVSRADVAVLIGGNDFRVYTVHRDDTAIADLLTIASAFWKRVETRNPPPIDDSPACREHFERKFKRSDAVELHADGELEQLFSTWRSLHLQAKDIDKKTETIRNEVRRALAEAQADRIVSSVGTAKLQARGGKPTTDWKLVAQLIGARVPREQFESIVEANTTKTEESLTLVAPRGWAKEAV